MRLWSQLATRYLREPHSPYGPGPHQIAGLARDDQLVAVGAEVLCEQQAEGFLGGAGRRAIVVGQVEVGDAQVEGAAQDRAAGFQDVDAAEVVPEAQRNRPAA